MSSAIYKKAIAKNPIAWALSPALLGCALGLWLVVTATFAPETTQSISAKRLETNPPNQAQESYAASATRPLTEVEQTDASDCAKRGVCGTLDGDPVFSIVADQRNWARIESLQASAMEVLSAIGHRDDRPVGVDFAAVSDVAKVLLIEGNTQLEDSFQLLFKNDAGQTVLLVELSSLGNDENGYEQLGYDSMLAFSDAIDKSLLNATGSAAKLNPPGFPYPTYPPITYQDALSSLGQPLDQLRDNDNSRTLATLKTENGDDMWGRALAYEVTLADAQGQPVPAWIDAFLGVTYSAQDLETAQANIEKRKAVDAAMDPKLRAALVRAGKLDDYLIESIPLSAKEAERREALRAHETSHGMSLANI